MGEKETVERGNSLPDFFTTQIFWALRRILWSHHCLAAEKEDSGSVVFEIPEAPGVGLDGLNLGVDPFGEAVGDVAIEIGQDVVEVFPEHPRNFLHLLHS